MGFGQPVQFFHAGTQAHPKPFTAAQGNQGVGELVATAQRVFFTEGVEVGEHAVAPPGRTHDQRRKHPRQQGGDQQEHLGVDAAQEQDAHGNHGNDDEGPHVGLQQQQATSQGQRHPHRQHGAEEVLLDLHAAHHVTGGVHHHCHLGQFRGLEVHEPERNPAPCAIDFAADEGQQHQQQQQQGGTKQPGRPLFPAAHGNLERQQGRHHADPDGDQLADQEMFVAQAAKTRVVGHGHGGRIDHDQAPAQQRHHDPEQGQVETHVSHHGCLPTGVIAAGQTHRQHPHATACRVRRLTGMAEPAGAPAQGLESGQRAQAGVPSCCCKRRTAATKTSARWA